MAEVHGVFSEAVRRVTRVRGLSRDQLVDRVNAVWVEAALSTDNLHHLATDRVSTVANVLGLVGELARLGEVEPLAAVARCAGFGLVPLSGGAPGDVLRAVGGYARDVAETGVEVGRAIEEGMSDERLAEIEREAREDEVARRGLLEAARAANRLWRDGR